VFEEEIDHIAASAPATAASGSRGRGSGWSRWSGGSSSGPRPTGIYDRASPRPRRSCRSPPSTRRRSTRRGGPGGRRGAEPPGDPL